MRRESRSLIQPSTRTRSTPAGSAYVSSGCLLQPILYQVPRFVLFLKSLPPENRVAEYEEIERPWFCVVGKSRRLCTNSCPEKEKDCKDSRQPPRSEVMNSLRRRCMDHRKGVRVFVSSPEAEAKSPEVNSAPLASDKIWLSADHQSEKFQP